MTRIIFACLAILLPAILRPIAAHAADLSVSDAFSRATPGSGPGVAYLVIHGGDTADQLIEVTSPRAKVEMHTMAMQGDVMRMRQVDAIDVPAGTTVRLAPGGQHLMLMGLSAPLKPGDTVPLTLKFAHAGDRSIDVPVGALGANGPAANPGPGK